MNRYLIASILALSFLAQGCVIVADGDDDATITVQNDSTYVIEYLYVTPSFSSNWGPDLLGNDVLFPGESATIGVDCGNYDVLVVDEFGVNCELFDFDLCFDDPIWFIDDFTLDICAFSVTGSSEENESVRKLEHNPRELAPESEIAQSL